MTTEVGGTVGTVVYTLVGLAMLFVVGYSIVWLYKDAETRGKSGCLVALLVFLLWPVGILIWLLFRPSDGRGR